MGVCRPLLSASFGDFFSSSDDSGGAFSTSDGTASFHSGGSSPSSVDTASSYFGDAFAADDTSSSSDDDTLLLTSETTPLPLLLQNRCFSFSSVDAMGGPCGSFAGRTGRRRRRLHISCTQHTNTGTNRVFFTR